ncbi:MAG: hypothetical protein RDU13_03595 [Elusimicrobiales bacterium]|nr:hypothetical protein [Elusimicrobiales bacterium]
MTSDGIFEEYVRIRDGIRYLSGGREYSREETEELLRSPDPFERARAWEMLRGGRAGAEDALVALLGRALSARQARAAAAAPAMDSGALLAAAASLRGPLLRALELKAGRVGASGFSCRDLRARLPAPADAQMPLAEALRRLGLILDGAVEGGRGLIMEFFPGNRLLLEGDVPLCLRPDPSSPAIVRLPESFRGVYPSDLPVIAHELGRAVQSDIASRAGGDGEFRPVFAGLIGHFFEELAWSGLIAGAGPHAASELAFDRLPRLAEDFLLVPAVLEFEEESSAAAAAGTLTPAFITGLDKEIFTRWLGADAEGAGFWTREGALFRPEPYGSLDRLAGRFLPLALSRGGRAGAADLEAAVADAAALAPADWLARRAPGGWTALAAAALDTLSVLE